MSIRDLRVGLLSRRTRAVGLEGIVAKRHDRAYRSGRSPDWIKVKNPDARRPLPFNSIRSKA